jgi:hypothetical protein
VHLHLAVESDHRSERVRDLSKRHSRVRRRQAELPLPHPASWWERREGLANRASILTAASS